MTDYEPGSYYVSVNSATDAFVTVSHGTIGIAIEEAVDAMVVDDGTGNVDDDMPDSDAGEDTGQEGTAPSE